jgi:hypothetical protein
MRKMWIWLLVFFLAGVKSVLAVNLEQTTIRPERMATSESPLPILVMVKTGTATIETGLRIRVGDGWVVSSGASDLTVSTVGLPNGVTAWPGIGTATSVTGQMVDFPSDDLNSSLTYGFFITGGVGVNPAVGDDGSYKWQVMTVAGGSPVDQTEIKMPVVAADTVTVTGKVGARASDFQLGIIADKTGNLTEGDEVTYQINYGSYLMTTTKPLVISAEWSRGTISGSPIPSVDIADYVVGSGTTAWGGVEPVVDLVNRKITWTISSFPMSTVNQTVEFRLRVNSSYSGTSEVSFKVTSYLTGAKVVTISSAVDNVYHPVQLVPTATLTPSTSSGSTISGPTATPTPEIKKPIVIEKIEPVILSNNGISIGTETNVEPKAVKVIYGLSAVAMTNSITSINGIKQDVIRVDGLKPGTDYYFRIEVTDSFGNIASSDIYTFRTATIASNLEIDKKSVLVSVADNILLDAKTENDGINAVVITKNQSYAVKVNLNEPESVRSMKIVVVNSQVLGINSVYGAEPNSVEVNLVEINKTGFVGHLASPKEEGYYQMEVKIEDINGNIMEEKIGELRVIPPLMVVDETNKPVENARVEFYRLNPDTRIYKLIGPEMFGFQNPSYTESNGQIAVNFPKGDYRIKVSEIGFADKQVDFTLGLGENEKMPQVVLKKVKMGFQNLVRYYGGVVNDAFSFSKIYLGDLTTSQRFFKLTTLVVVVTWVMVVWLFVSRTLRVYWWLLPNKMIREIRNWRPETRSQKNILEGRILESTTKMPIVGVKVYLVDDNFNKVLSRGLTDSLGEFCLTIKSAKGYRLAAVKDGFEPTPMLDFTKEGIGAGRVELLMNDVISAEEKAKNVLINVLLIAGKWLMWLWLLGLMLMELIFWRNFGLVTNWWEIIFSGVSVGLWLKMILKKDELEKN